MGSQFVIKREVVELFGGWVVVGVTVAAFIDSDFRSRIEFGMTTFYFLCFR